MTPEQQRLLDKANRSLQAARELNNTGFPEFATSRAYYSMFYIATAFLEAEGVSYSRHSAVIAAFGERFARTNRVPVELHRYLIDNVLISCAFTTDEQFRHHNNAFFRNIRQEGLAI